ncbi:hypothetical protein FHL15_011010 [Xylaria flabelliformis]|uniref:Uncharacterized protein n=1 Tax=Xylaria flabelliformis TaxID=2512241 RepID=A0A553HJI9_9PEZI|nr:hypothetical protein FHL15_011010 [Xylaria flabelliformis]
MPRNVVRLQEVDDKDRENVTYTKKTECLSPEQLADQYSGRDTKRKQDNETKEDTEDDNTDYVSDNINIDMKMAEASP